MTEQVAAALVMAFMVGGGLGLAVWAALAGHVHR